MGKSTHWAAVFAVITVLSAMLGFGGGAGAASTAAIVLCWLSLTVMIVALVGSLLRNG
ncbi:MAG: DUF1328 domain-containing protein [Hyphomicrobium sp.]|nr:DUF1328 domain-containing protein [Hyphomicrobium sp.]